MPVPEPGSERGAVLKKRPGDADGAGQHVLQQHTEAQGAVGGGSAVGFGSEYLPFRPKDGCGQWILPRSVRQGSPHLVREQSSDWG